MDNRFDELLDELNKLKIFNPTAYIKRLEELKAKNPAMYRRLIEPLGIDDSKIVPIATPKVKPKKSSNAALLIIAVSLSIIVFAGIMIFFITSLPEQSAGLNSSQSINLGYGLFGSINKTYLMYSSQMNITSPLLGNQQISKREYCLNERGTITSMIKVMANGSSNELIFHKMGGDYYNCKTQSPLNASLADKFNAMMIYDEIHSRINAENANYSKREGVWKISDIECAPIVVEIMKNKEFFHYEICLDNDGIPVAVGERYVNQKDSYEIVYVSFLESTDSSMIKRVKFGNRTIDEWSSQCVSR